MSFLDLSGFVTTFLAVMAALFVFAVGVGVLLLTILYFIDITQTQHAIRRNFPVIGRLRYQMEHLGVFFRQYFYAMDREEMPFNRAQRGWVYRAAKNLDNTQPFGSTRDLRPPGTLLFANTAFPALDTAAETVPPLVIGPDCAQPYAAGSFFNISAMSYGAISQPAVRALSNGARLAGCWLNTGEGGLSPYHLAGGADLVGGLDVFVLLVGHAVSFPSCSSIISCVISLCCLAHCPSWVSASRLGYFISLRSVALTCVWPLKRRKLSSTAVVFRNTASPRVSSSGKPRLFS